MVFFSHSGNTEEVNYAAELVQKHQVPLLSIVGSKGELLKKALIVTGGGGGFMTCFLLGVYR